jgi:hypothetical protein
MFWIGQFKDDKHLYFELLDKKIQKKLKDNNYSFIDDWAFDVFNLEEIVGLSDFDAQKIILNKFFKNMMDKIRPYISKIRHITGLPESPLKCPGLSLRVWTRPLGCPPGTPSA